MKKSLNRGFVMAETIVISMVVLTALVIIYVQFIAINNSYYRSFNYNNVNDLYALEKVKDFILDDNYDDIISQLSGKSYVDITDCSSSYFREYAYCKVLLNTAGIKSLILTYEDVSRMKNDLKTTNPLSQGMTSFVKTISSSKNNRYRLIAEFEDRYATLKLGTFIAGDATNTCVLSGNTCSLEQIKNGVSLSVAVGDEETYRFHVLADDGTKLTLIMDDHFNDSITWGSNIVDYASSQAISWSNIPESTYSVGGSDASTYTNCPTYDSCTSNSHTESNINSNVRVPLLQQLVALGCTDTAGSCPSFLYSDLNNENAVGLWTFSTKGTDAWVITNDGKVNAINASSGNIKLKPIIVINKSLVQ